MDEPEPAPGLHDLVPGQHEVVQSAGVSATRNSLFFTSAGTPILFLLPIRKTGPS